MTTRKQTEPAELNIAASNNGRGTAAGGRRTTNEQLIALRPGHIQPLHLRAREMSSSAAALSVDDRLPVYL